MIEYTFERRQDKYFIKNEGTITIEYKLKKLFDCVNFLDIFNSQILPGDEIEISFTGDGEYQVILNDGTNPEVELSIKYYLTLQTSIIESVFSILCDCECGCNSCAEDSDNKFCDLLMTRAKIDTFKRLTNPEGIAFYNTVYKQTKCLIENPIYCAISEELILGEAKCNEKIIKQFIALDYLAMYFFEYYQVCLSEDKQCVRDKFKTEKIFCCIQKLDINIGEIENLITTSIE